MENVLSGQAGFAQLDPRDRAFARLITATTFRRLGQIDAALKPLLKRPPRPLAHAVLRTAAAQILFLKTPPHAAVGESVALLKQNKKSQPFAGLVNAVLRKLVASGPKIAAQTPLTANIPGWLRSSWESAYGKPALRRMAAELTQEPPLDLYVPKNIERWAEQLGGQIIDTHTIRLKEYGHIPDLSGYLKGEWWVQDVAASQPINMLGDLAGLTALDMCAAPGGKTLQLASRGAAVTALDKSETRLNRLKDNLKRTGLSADIMAADAFEWAKNTDQKFDIVLLDAPCSATGTFRRHPDVLYNKTPKMVGSLVHIQRKLLDIAAALTAKGGRLVYCSCSLQPEEGEAQTIAFLKRHAGWQLESPTVNILQNIADVPSKTDNMRLLPHYGRELGGMDGFYTAILRPQ